MTQISRVSLQRKYAASKLGNFMRWIEGQLSYSVTQI